jgi:hypothetical protein
MDPGVERFVDRLLRREPPQHLGLACLAGKARHLRLLVGREHARRDVVAEGAENLEVDPQRRGCGGICAPDEGHGERGLVAHRPDEPRR